MEGEKSTWSPEGQEELVQQEGMEVRFRQGEQLVLPRTQSEHKSYK